MRANSGRSFGVTLSQFCPPLRVTCTRPSSDPAQIVLMSCGVGAIVNTTPYVSTPVLSFVIGPPDAPIVFGSWRDRSGLIRVHVWPAFAVFQMCCDEL